MTDTPRAAAPADVRAAGQIDTAEDLYENAPCGYLSCFLDGSVARVNDTFLGWTGYTRDELVGSRRFVDLLSPGGRIYHETHYAPLLRMQGSVRSIALDIVCKDGTRMPVLVDSRVRTGPADEPLAIRTTIFDARDRKAYEAELLTARRRAEQATAWMTAVEQVVAELAAASSVDEVCRVVSAAGPRVLGAGASGVWLTVAGSGGWAWLETDATGDAAPPVDLLPGSAALRAGELVRGSADDPDEQRARARLGDGPGELLLTPLVAGERTLGVLGLLAPPEATGSEPLRLVATLGRQAGQALDRARLSDEQRQVATTLQQSMLPASLPSDDRLALSACYRPAIDGLTVGGDWYDAFRLDQHRVALVVGDVVGRGLHAAAAMGQLRSAVRALAAADAGPAVLLTRLDSFVEGVPAAETATLAYAEVDLRTGSAVYACAGHPPPVVVHPDGRAALLWEGRSTPLGAHFGRTRSQAGVELAPGSRLALYTDGLVELRDTPLDETIEALAEVLTRLADHPVTGLADAVADSLLGPTPTGDDVCLLAVEVHPAPDTGERGT